MIRVLVALSPRMYRQAIALSVQRGRPGLVEVRIAPPQAAEAELASFRPHLLVHDEDSRGGSVPIPEAALEGVPCRLEIYYAHGMDARLHADGSTTEMPGASTDDLLAAVDAAAQTAEREEHGHNMLLLWQLDTTGLEPPRLELPPVGGYRHLGH